MKRCAQFKFKSEVEVSSHIPASKVSSTFPFNLNSFRNPICYLLSAARGRRLPAAGYRNSLNPISYLLTPARLGLLALTVLAATGWGQFNLTNTNYSQNFNALGTNTLSNITDRNLNNVSTNLNIS